MGRVARGGVGSGGVWRGGVVWVGVVPILLMVCLPWHTFSQGGLAEPQFLIGRLAEMLWANVAFPFRHSSFPRDPI
jgi:hypothetical protein